MSASLLSLSMLVGCSHLRHCNCRHNGSTAEPPQAAAKPIMAVPVAKEPEKPQLDGSERVMVTVTAPGPDGKGSRTGVVEMSAGDAAAIGMVPGFHPGVVYAPPDMAKRPALTENLPGDPDTQMVERVPPRER
jgi:hypothetical protein